MNVPGKTSVFPETFANNFDFDVFFRKEIIFCPKVLESRLWNGHFQFFMCPRLFFRVPALNFAHAFFMSGVNFLTKKFFDSDFFSDFED